MEKKSKLYYLRSTKDFLHFHLGLYNSSKNFTFNVCKPTTHLAYLLELKQLGDQSILSCMKTKIKRTGYFFPSVRWKCWGGGGGGSGGIRRVGRGIRGEGVKVVTAPFFSELPSHSLVSSAFAICLRVSLTGTKNKTSHCSRSMNSLHTGDPNKTTWMRLRLPRTNDYFSGDSESQTTWPDPGALTHTKKAADRKHGSAGWKTAAQRPRRQAGTCRDSSDTTRTPRRARAQTVKEGSPRLSNRTSVTLRARQEWLVKGRERRNPGTLGSTLPGRAALLCPLPRPFSTPVPTPALGLGATPPEPLWGQTESTERMRGLLASVAPARAPAALWAAGRAPPPGLLTNARPRHQPERPAGEQSTDPEPHLHQRAGSDCAWGPPERRAQAPGSGLRGPGRELGEAVGPHPLEGEGVVPGVPSDQPATSASGATGERCPSGRSLSCLSVDGERRESRRSLVAERKEPNWCDGSTCVEGAGGGRRWLRWANPELPFLS